MSNTASPSWRQLAAIPESTTKAAILKALDITPQPQGISNTFTDSGLFMSFSPAQDSISYWIVSNASDGERSLASMLYTDGSNALAATGTKAGTPIGDALRLWMRSKGWLPRNERRPADPTENTRTII
jgi:hypothetical protein